MVSLLEILCGSCGGSVLQRPSILQVFQTYWTLPSALESPTGWYKLRNGVRMSSPYPVLSK